MYSNIIFIIIMNIKMFNRFLDTAHGTHIYLAWSWSQKQKLLLQFCRINFLNLWKSAKLIEIN